MFEPGEKVRLNLANMMIEGVGFGSAVTDALGSVVRQVNTDPPTYRVRLAFAFKGLQEVEVPEDRIRRAA